MNVSHLFCRDYTDKHYLYKIYSYNNEFYAEVLNYSDYNISNTFGLTRIYRSSNRQFIYEINRGVVYFDYCFLSNDGMSFVEVDYPNIIHY